MYCVWFSNWCFAYEGAKRMSVILTNPEVAKQMDELEIRARKGDPWAQNELSKRSMQFANAMMNDVSAGADMLNRKEMLSK